MSVLLTPKFKTAKKAPLPGDLGFWQMMLDQSDNFSYQTANNNKGGPFGAQLWLVREGRQTEYVLVGSENQLEDSNAVVSKGIASAHAEAENLSVDQRERVMNFLRENRNQGWKVVQVSSGESCQSCRTKQVLFAEELIKKGLIMRGDFHVAYKATFQQTKRDANFSDAEYDMAFRAISELGILDQEKGLLGLEDALQKNPVTSQLIKSGELVYVPVREVAPGSVSNDVRRILNTDAPVAVVVSKGGEIMSIQRDQRNIDAPLNVPEEAAIMSSLQAAAKIQRDMNASQPWNLNGARLYTNISDIGPSYGEALWYNLSSINIVRSPNPEKTNCLAREIYHLSNCYAFKLAAMEYNAPGSPISVRFLGDENGANFAHLLWKAKIAREGALARQAERLEKFSGLNIKLIGGGSLPVEQFVEHTRQSSHYDGKQADGSEAGMR